MNLLQPKITKYLRDSLAMITNMAKSLNVKKEAALKLSQQVKPALERYESFKTQFENKEHFEKLSAPEKQALYTNAQNYVQTIQEMQKEIDYLDMARYPEDIHRVINYLEEAYMLVNFILETLQGDSGEIAYAKLNVIKPNKFAGMSYKLQIVNLESELDVMVTDIQAALENIMPDNTSTAIIIIDTYTRAWHNMVLAMEWLNHEIERYEKEPKEKPREFKLPTIVAPEKPEGPSDEDNKE